MSPCLGVEDGDVRSVKCSAAPQVVVVQASLGHGPVWATTSGSPCLECFRIATKAISEFKIHTMEDLPEVQRRRLSTSLREVEERRLVIAVDYGTTYTGMARG